MAGTWRHCHGLHNGGPCDIDLLTVRLLLIDDHPLIHVAIKALLADFSPAVQLEGADGAVQALACLARGLPDLILLDLQLRDEDGFLLLDQLRELHTAVPIVCMSGSDQMSDVIRAIDHGAMGFIPKHVDPEEFKAALMLVVTGGIYVPEMRAVNGALPLLSNLEVPQAVQPAALDSLPITPRQRDVLQCLLQGKPNKLIASELRISAETVKDHVHAIYRALGVSTRTQAVLAVSQMTRSRV
jgi:DNA-binding NarL/FixJ family response regulator